MLRFPVEFPQQKNADKKNTIQRSFQQGVNILRFLADVNRSSSHQKSKNIARLIKGGQHPPECQQWDVDVNPLFGQFYSAFRGSA
jgi:hypothetical protein